MEEKGKKERSESVRKLIIQTTIEIIKNNGLEAVSVRNISKKMGYTPGVIYYHFNNKQEIMDAVHDTANQEIIRIIKSSQTNNRGTMENIGSVFYEVMKIALKDKAIFELIMFDKYSNRNESINPWLDMIEMALEHGVAQKELKEIDVKQAAFCIWSAYTGFLYMIGKEKEVDFAALDASFCTMEQILAKGIETDEQGGLL